GGLADVLPRLRTGELELLEEVAPVIEDGKRGGAIRDDRDLALDRRGLPEIRQEVAPLELRARLGGIVDEALEVGVPAGGEELLALLGVVAQEDVEVAAAGQVLDLDLLAPETLRHDLPLDLDPGLPLEVLEARLLDLGERKLESQPPQPRPGVPAPVEAALGPDGAAGGNDQGGPRQRGGRGQ